jgi:hypothetical protein
LKIAQVRHGQNEMVRIAKVTGKQPVLAEPAVRQSVARNQQRELAQIQHRINVVAEQAAAARAKLKLIDHKNDTLIAAMGRQELRAMLRTMKPEERTAAMRKVTFRMAALEAEPELSGVPELLHSRLYEEELAAKLSAEVEGADEALNAAEIVRETLNTTRLAVEAELIASGTTVSELAEPAPTKEW